MSKVGCIIVGKGFIDDQIFVSNGICCSPPTSTSNYFIWSCAFSLFISPDRSIFLHICRIRVFGRWKSRRSCNILSNACCLSLQLCNFSFVHFPDCLRLLLKSRIQKFVRSPASLLLKQICAPQMICLFQNQNSLLRYSFALTRNPLIRRCLIFCSMMSHSG